MDALNGRNKMQAPQAAETWAKSSEQGSSSIHAGQKRPKLEFWTGSRCTSIETQAHKQHEHIHHNSTRSKKQQASVKCKAKNRQSKQAAKRGVGAAAQPPGWSYSCNRCHAIVANAVVLPTNWWHPANGARVFMTVSDGSYNIYQCQLLLLVLRHLDDDGGRDSRDGGRRPNDVNDDSNCGRGPKSWVR